MTLACPSPVCGLICIGGTPARENDSRPGQAPEGGTDPVSQNK